MNNELHQKAMDIINDSIESVKPDEAVRRALKAFAPKGGRVLLVAAGKAAWQMAHAAVEALGRVDGGVVVTKYDHVKGEIPGVKCYEAGHPVPDENSFAATERALELVHGLTEKDTVLFLLSGGGSALFEKPLIPGAELQGITNQLLASGADIVEMNTIRKRLSAVKGGRFAQACAPAKVFSIVLSDILGDPLDMIASGPAVPDSSTCAQALAIAEKYHLNLSEQAKALLAQETPKVLDNVITQITGSVRELCAAAAEACRELGYEPILLTDRLCCEAKEAGSFLGSIACTNAGQGKKLAFIAGSETVVHLTGKGQGGAIRSSLWPQLRRWQDRTPQCSPWAVTAPTVPPMPLAAMWTATPPPLWQKRAGTCSIPCKTTMPTTPCRPWRGLSSQEPPAPMSMMWLLPW